MQRLDETKLRLLALETLRALRLRYQLKELAERLGLQQSVLSRYVHGKVMPTTERALAIIELARKDYFPEFFASLLRKTPDGLYDLSQILQDQRILRTVGLYTSLLFSGSAVEKVLTVATDGVPLAVHVASELGAQLVIAKPVKDPVYTEFVEERIVRSPPVVEYVYLPKRAIRRSERVLIVDDFVRSGRTVEALLRFVERSGAVPVGVFAVAVMDSTARSLRERFPDLTLEYLVELPQS
ncbi:MAG: phosphoribosyltransferase family protein [Nitrososphaerota archaeon]|nr:phosphoribosyltransferase family protein [Candidatus Calditenuis fumarioli]